MFTTELLKRVTEPGVSINDLFLETGRGVMEATGGRQIPAIYNQYFGTMYLAGSPPVSPVVTTPDSPAPGFQVEQAVGSIRVSVTTGGTVYLDDVEAGSLEAGQSAVLSGVKPGTRSVEIRYADGEREAASVVVSGNTVATAAFSYVVERTPAPESPTQWAVLVEGGSFEMGDENGDPDEQPVHVVRLNSFLMMNTEVTFGEYDEYASVVGSSLPDDGGWGRGTRPVINVSWLDAVRYANWLSERDGLTPYYTVTGTTVSRNRNTDGWRLPTEAEWEYAARGGRNTPGAKYAGGDGAGDVAWFVTNSGGRTHPVGEKPANEFGLYDMNGNVREWCFDWYDEYHNDIRSNPAGPGYGTLRVVRGGGWNGFASSVTITARDRVAPVMRRNDLGFRLVRSMSD